MSLQLVNRGRHEWELPGHGSFRIVGLRGGKSTIDVSGRTIEVRNRGRFPGRVEFSEAGSAIGSFVPHGMFRSGATLELDGTTWEWTVDGRFRWSMRCPDGAATFDGRRRDTVSVDAEGVAESDSAALVVGAFLARVASEAKRRRRRTAVIAGAAGSGGSS